SGLEFKCGTAVSGRVWRFCRAPEALQALVGLGVGCRTGREFASLVVQALLALLLQYLEQFAEVVLDVGRDAADAVDEERLVLVPARRFTQLVPRLVAVLVVLAVEIGRASCRERV